MVDLAITRWSSPVTDISYFLSLSTTPQLRRTHLDKFLEHYHNALISNFHKLGEDPTVYTFRYEP